MNIRTVIVDDVELARERIKMLLTDEDIEIIAECANGREAVKTINKLKPDLVFLDVQMPEIGGFDVVEILGLETMPAVIFITAYDEFAIRAFEINAVDYLLKPFDEQRLAKAVRRAKNHLRQKDDELENRLRKLLTDVKPESKYISRIPIKNQRGTFLVLTEEIDWIKSAGHYLELFCGSEKYLIREKLATLESRLDPDKFVRIHRSMIVNIERIKSYHPLFNGDQLIILKDNTELNLSRTYFDNLMRRLSM